MNNIFTQNDINRQQRQFETINNVINQFGYMINPNCTDPFIPIKKLDVLQEEGPQNESFAGTTQKLLNRMKRNNVETKRPITPNEVQTYWGAPQPIPTDWFRNTGTPIKKNRSSSSKRKRRNTISNPLKKSSDRKFRMPNSQLRKSAPAGMAGPDDAANRAISLVGGKKKKYRTKKSRTKKSRTKKKNSKKKRNMTKKTKK